MEYLFLLLIFFGLSYVAYSTVIFKRREKFIRQYQFPNTIVNKVSATYPHLSEQDLNKVIQALKDYFAICHTAKMRMIAMPSQVVDVAWHEFILFTRDYKTFCQNSFGKFLHHTPAEAMKSQTKAQNGIKRAWRIACKRENINHKSPNQLPLLFALDNDLEIADGFNYVIDCKKGPTHSNTIGVGYCASHIGCGGGCSGGSDGDGGCSGGCGGD